MKTPEAHPTLFDRPILLVTCPRGWEAEARQELRRLLPGAKVDSLYIGGNIVAQPDTDLDEALDAIREAETYVIAHVTPVTLRMQIGPEAAWVDAMEEAARQLPPPDPERTFMVDVHRRGRHQFNSTDVTLSVADAFVRAGRPEVDLDDPEQVLSVEIFQDLCFMGMNHAEDLLRKRLKRMRRWAPGERPINRAELKLSEAIEQFALSLPEGARALDLGAAPGGWTRVLAGHVREVVAVDPADLDERVSELENVTHLRCRTEELEPEEIGRFDLLTNDMNLEPARSAELMCELSRLLKPGGLAVMTIKFVTRRQNRHVGEATSILSRCYEDLRIAHMPHNAKETTVVMRARADASVAGDR
ncbi:MAG: SAM-dependent methyltransferase [Armatimonadota bacterium]